MNILSIRSPFSNRTFISLHSIRAGTDGRRAGTASFPSHVLRTTCWIFWIGTALLGFSDGGNIALTFALRHPKRVEKLVLNGANIDPSGVRRSVQAPIEIGYAMARRFAARSEKARANAEMLGLMVNEPHIAPEELKKLDLPVLVIAGTKDMIRREHTELIARSLPRAQLVFLKGDHFIANREPEAFNRAVSAFLAAP